MATYLLHFRVEESRRQEEDGGVHWKGFPKVLKSEEAEAEEANSLFEMNPLLILEWVCPPDWNQRLLPGEELVVAVKVLKVNRVPWKKIKDDDVVS